MGNKITIFLIIGIACVASAMVWMILQNNSSGIASEPTAPGSPIAGPTDTRPPIAEPANNRPPMLEIIFTSDDGSTSRINTIMTASQWYYKNKDGTTGGVLADAPHPLDIGYLYDDEYTLYLEGAAGEVELSFSYYYPPDTLSVQRWDTVYLGMKPMERYDYAEDVSISKNRFRIESDGNDYIYVLNAKWDNVNATSSQGRAMYSFRVNN